jgi:hypothetical protein
MATPVRTRLTASEGRRFGFTVGGAFLVLGLIAWWRGRPTLASVLAAAGGLLVLAALVVPTRLGPIERLWMTFAHRLSRFTTPVVMAIMYFGIITPLGILRRLFAHNPIVQRETTTGFWKARDQKRSRLERQF